MALNFPGPYEVRLIIGVGGRTHVQKLNCQLAGTPDPFLTFADYNVIRRNTAQPTLQAAVDEWVALIKTVYEAAAADIVRAELWKYEPDSFDASFFATYDISVAGTSGSSTVGAGQLIFTFRTEEGGIMKISLMETVSLEGVTQFPPYGAGNNKNISDYVIGATNWILARDTSYPVANLALHPGRNEALFKKLFRP